MECKDSLGIIILLERPIWCSLYILYLFISNLYENEIFASSMLFRDLSLKHHTVFQKINLAHALSLPKKWAHSLSILKNTQ